MPKITLATIALVTTALAAGAAVYLLTCLVEPPRQALFIFGVEWARMSVQPFEFVGPFPHRLLSPLLAHLVGLDGVDLQAPLPEPFATGRYIWFSRLLSVCLLATVFGFCRQRGRDWIDALLITAAVGFSGAVQSYKILVGYSDNLTYTLLLLGLLAVRHGGVFWTLHFANLCNHELAFFFVPWLWFTRRQAGRSPRADVLGLAITTALYIGFRLWVGQHAEEQQFTVGYFFQNTYLPWGTMALWVLAVVHLLATFGPLLVVMCWHDGAPRPDRDRLHTVLIAAGILSIYAVAYDVMRHTNLMFLPLVIASVRFLEGRRARPVFAVILLASILSYILLGPRVLERINALVVECEVFPEYGRLLTCLLPRIWGRLVGLGVGLAFVLWLARWLRRTGIGSPAS